MKSQEIEYIKLRASGKSFGYIAKELSFIL